MGGVEGSQSWFFFCGRHEGMTRQKRYERAHRVKRNNDNNENNNRNSNHQNLLLDYYISKTNKIFCMKQNYVKLDFLRET